MMGRTEDVLAEIARPGSTRDSIAAVCAAGIRRHFGSDAAWDVGDWPTVTAALRQRYTWSGVDYILQLGWKLSGFR